MTSESPASRPPDDTTRVDELRQRLRSLGYLDAGVDRFVLGPARATRQPWSIALFASLRVGALGAILLGPAAALGLSARMPGLVAGPRDAVVVALYLGLFFGVAVAAAASIAGLVVSFAVRRSGPALARRGERLSTAAGLLVTLACLTYFTLWWRTVVSHIGWSAPVWTLSALSVAVAISLLLGHAVTLMSSAVVVAAAGAPDAQRVAGHSWRTTIAAGLVALGGAALLLAWSMPAPPIASPALTVVPTGLRVRVIAIDGFDPAIFQELSALGRMPSLTAAFDGAVMRIEADERRDELEDPARVWTTVATGQPPGVHGVEGLETRRVAGISGSVPTAGQSRLGGAIRGATDLLRLTRPSIASGVDRRVKTFWEVAADAGLRTAVVNWWATWPARGDRGIVLSDRATLRLEHGGALDAEIAPASVYDTLRQRWTQLKQQAVALAGTIPPTAIENAATRALLQRSAELDAIQLTLLSTVSTKDMDLSVVYLPGLDITQHALLGSTATTPQNAAPRSATLTASDLAGRLAALREYYASLDRMLSSTLAHGPDEVVVIVTQPGRVGGSTGARMAVSGSTVAARRVIEGTATSVASTILQVLGVPISRELPGPPRVEVLDDAVAKRYPVRFVTTYGEPVQGATTTTGRPLDQEMIDRLRSLGYVR